jgi:hypothetical protein
MEKMQKHIKRKNVRAIGEIQRKSRENPEEELHTSYRKLVRQFAIFRFSNERQFLIYTVSALYLLEVIILVNV